VSVTVRQTSAAGDAILDSWDNPQLSSHIRKLFWFLGAVLGLTQAIASRFNMNVDGISYLDLASAYLSHNGSAAVNGYWSPLYPWILGAAMWLTRVPMY